MAVILIVDDRPINREFLSALLGYAGHEVHEARDGREALKVARRVDPALVITDILMPTMDGVELARRLGAEPGLSAVPVIFHTATYRVGEARTLAAECGVSTVIGKPSEPQELLDAIQGELGLTARIAAPEQLPAWNGQRSNVAVDRLCTTSVAELTGLRTRLRDTIDEDDRPSGKVRELRQISTQLDTSLSRAQALSMRLAALVELSLDLAAQKDPASMLEMFCHATRDILNARLAAVCTLDESGAILEYAAWGMTDEELGKVRADLTPTAGIWGDIMRDGASRRYKDLSGRHDSLGLPSSHPPICSLLGVPVKSATRTHGWFYVADRLGKGEFSEEDEQLALTLAAQLAPEYENLVLYERIRRHAELLEAEVDERKQALAELRESETRFRQLAENVREVFFLIEAESGKLLYVSPTYEEMWSRSRESLYESPDSWLDAVHPADSERVAREIAQVPASGRLKLKFRIQRQDDVGWIKAQSFPVRDAAGRVHRIAGIAEDITESRLQEQRIERLMRIQAVLSGINSAIVRIRERGVLLDEACRIAAVHGGFAVAWIGLYDPKASGVRFVTYNGKNPELARALSSLLVDEAATDTGLAAQALRSKAHVIQNDVRATAGGNRVLDLASENGCASAVALPLIPDGVPIGAIILFAEEAEFFDAEEVRLLDELAGDVSFALEYIDREEQLNYLAYYDPLTDLPNTALFHQHVAKSIEQNAGLKTAVFLIDLDHFTHLNDTLGRHIGDRLLASFGKRLRSLVSTHGSLARIGADTFAVAVPALRNEADAGTVLQEWILAALARPFQLDGNDHLVSARVGIATYPADAGDSESLFKNAESALKQAKTSGTRYLFYSEKLNERVGDDLALERRLLAAVERQEFLMYYQPKIDAASGMIVGLEALLRWNSPEDGLVAPAHFIPMLETSDLILDVGRWVLERTLTDYKAWQEKGLKPPRVAVNVSARQLRYADFTEMVLTAVGERGVTGDALELEITETVIMADIEASIERLEELSRRNITIAVDDFGTGYSSLRYIAKLPMHALKIDRSFINGMIGDKQSMALVSTIIGLGHAFELEVVAEGVETREQAEALRLMECDLLQGYFFGRPQPAEGIDALLAAQR